MSNQLRLMLERVISVSRVSSALELPLDRKLGDLSRYKYVYADALPLRMERKISEQPDANKLRLSLSQPLGTLAPPIYVTSNALPLPLSVPLSEQPPSNALPLGLTRKLGTVTGVYIPPIEPPAPINVNIAISATAQIAPVAQTSISASLPIVQISIIATATLNPTASMVATYDANVFRGAMADVASDMQCAKLQGIDKCGGFESNALLTGDVASDYQQSKLTGIQNQAQFEANKRLTTDSTALFESSRLIGVSNQQGAENQAFIASKTQVKSETAKHIGHEQWYSFEAMAYRQTQRAIHGENGKLIADWLDVSGENDRLIGLSRQSRAETAMLPKRVTRYVPPSLWQTVILKQQIIEGWECGSGDLQHYVYNDELYLPMHRRIADRGASSSLALPMNSPRGVLTLPAIDANALPNYPCKRKTLGVNPTLDTVVRLRRERRNTPSSLAFNGVGKLYAVAVLILTEGGYDKGVIFVTNSVSLNRTDDGREIKLLSFDVGIDSNSYTWSFNATVPLSELSKVNTAYEQRIGVDLVVNGNLWRFILDGCDDNASFGSSSLTIKGKSRAMLLAHPYATQRGFKYDTAMSARQIAEDELNRGGVPSGFTLDWQLAGINGWDIPANTYSYTGKTPINSLQWIAEAAGGFINAHMSDDIIHVLANYPTPSWEWAAQRPSINLPISLITSRSRGRVYKPNYNGALVSGEKAGSISALIKRRGTSGGYQPPMVTSDLITDTAAAISRGKAMLSDVGDIGNINIAMPLHDDFGVLKPSTLIGVNDGEQWIGMVRGTKISGKLSGNQTLEIEQSIDIERHFDKELV